MDTNINIFIILFVCLSILVINAKLIKPRIYGSTNACGNEFPYQGFVTIHDVYTCSATLITKLHFLTAANCVAEIVGERPVKVEVYVKIGSPNIFNNFAYPVKRISHHPDYREKNVCIQYNNIAVIHLQFEVTTSLCISPITLPPKNFKIQTGTEVIVSGFGGRNIEERLSPVLAKITTLVLSYDACTQWLPGYSLRDFHLCTLTGQNFGCSFGDLGNPMVDASKSILLGISSLKHVNCFNLAVNIYTEVSPFIKYIEEEVNYYNPNVELLHAPPAVNFAIKSEQYF